MAVQKTGSGGSKQKPKKKRMTSKRKTISKHEALKRRGAFAGDSRQERPAPAHRKKKAPRGHAGSGTKGDY